MSAAQHVYAADLASELLGELLVKIHRHRVPGVIHAEQGETVKRLFVKDGNVVYASSNDRSDRLGPYLLETGRISEEQLQELADLRRTSSTKFGLLMMDAGLLSPEEIKATIQEQVERIAWSIFSWTSGSARFEIHELRERNLIRIQVPILHMVLRGTRYSSERQRALECLGGGDSVLVAGYDAEEAIDIALDADEYQLLRQVDGETTVSELAAACPLGEDEAIRLLFAFITLGLVQEKNPNASGRRMLLKTRGGRSS